MRIILLLRKFWRGKKKGKKRKSWLEFQIINFLNAIKYTVRLQLCSDTRQSVDRADGGVMLDFVAGRVDWTGWQSLTSLVPGQPTNAQPDWDLGNLLWCLSFFLSDLSCWVRPATMFRWVARSHDSQQNISLWKHGQMLFTSPATGFNILANLWTTAMFMNLSHWH